MRQKGTKAIVITIKSTFEEGQWVCLCREFGLSNFGKDLKKTMDELLEMVIDHVEVMDECGDLEDFLDRHRVMRLFVDHEPPVRRLRIPVDSADSPLSFTSSRYIPEPV